MRSLPTLIPRLRTLRLTDVLRAVLIPLIGGWIVAGAYGLMIVVLQTDQMAHSRIYNSGPNLLLGAYIDTGYPLPIVIDRLFAPERIASGTNARLASLLGQGPGLILPQIAVVVGLLVWMIMRTVKRTQEPYLFGVVCGVLVALVDCAIALFVLHVPIILVVTLFSLIVGAAWFGVWSGIGAAVVPVHK
jgi:hypothetical protein